MRTYIKTGLFFLHKRIKVIGKENIPKKGAVIFIGNHQNALIDAILIPTTNNRNIHFLARAAAFKNKPISSFLTSLNMIPVYRIRDGFKKVEKNIEIFEKCVELLKKGKAIEIFAEGQHHLFRRIMPLKKGFARIITSTLKKHPDLEIQIVPVGINYDSRLKFPASVSIHYGKPILANNFINIEKPDPKFSKIMCEVSNALKGLTLHVDDLKNYNTIISKANSLNVDFTNPIEANTIVKNIEKSKVKPSTKKINWFLPLHIITKINSAFPLLIWNYLKPKITEVIFMNTYRFALILTIFPLFYLIQTGILGYIFNSTVALCYLVITILLAIITSKTSPIN
ncbi:lysophospholipid acyltransferase family protein [Lutibacter citreus]|uniref:lysophospholipid acyltransferase family protein n=1 Tax=Lutibacter citreus TaxID=2138210 RepID=UPI000DBE03FF|nr:lysophospholipid acyltransferase family protein [Lutibacter citreus]